MRIEEEFATLVPERETMLTIGVFDGVHRGHQHLLNTLMSRAGEKGWLSGVVTFRTHPEKVLFPGTELPWLNDFQTRGKLLKKLGIDIVLPLTFTPELARLNAREFVRLLRDYQKMRGLVIGPDFALGKGRQGNAQQLGLLGKELGFTVEVVPPAILDGQVVSSSAIRQFIAEGNMEMVAKLLGRPFSLSGRVVSGDGRGTSLGFPTANLDIKPYQAMPNDGVYVTVAHVGRKLMPSVTNIGLRPTFGGNKRSVETYLLDYDGHLLNQRFKIDLIKKLRGEKRFDNPQQLKAQIARDVAQTRAVLKDILGEECQPRK